MALQLSRQHQQQLLDWAKAAGNTECCGLLFGSNDRVEAIELTANAAQDPRMWFEIDPAALIAAEKRASGGGPTIIGYFHSHPNGRAWPSEADEKAAAADGRYWLIIADGDVTAWRPEADRDKAVTFREESLVWG